MRKSPETLRIKVGDATRVALHKEVTTFSTSWRWTQATAYAWLRIAAALRFVFLVWLVLCCGLATGAQQNSAPPANQNEPAPTIRTQTNLIVVRVIVRDANGNPVSDLSHGDFQVFDNKKAQVISYFSAEAPKTVSPAEAKSAEGVQQNATGPTPVAPQRFTALYFDDYHLTLGNLGQIRDAAKRYVAKRLDKGARVAIYSTSGKVHVEFTSDRDKLEQALSQLQFDLRVQTESECPPMTDYQAQEIAGGTLADAAPPAPTNEPPSLTEESPSPIPASQNARKRSPPPSNPEAPHADPGPLEIAAAVGGALRCSPEDLRARASLIARENDQDAETTLTALDNLVRRMAETPGGERTIAMVSEGFLNKKLQQQMDALIDRALRAKVIINALDAQGLYTPAGTEVDAALLGIDPTGRLQNAYENLQTHSVDLDADVLAEAAEGTGGITIKNSNDFEGGLARMTAPYTTYVLAFSPANSAFDGKFHALTVKLVNSAQFTVQARRGYYAPKHAEDAATATAASEKEEMERALFSWEDINGLPIQISTNFAKVDQQTTKITVTVDADMHSVRFRKEGGSNQDDLTLMVALFDPDGNYVTGKNETISLRLPDAGLAQLRGAGGETTAELTVKPGSYLVRAVLRESASQLLGAANQSLVIR